MMPDACFLHSGGFIAAGALWKDQEAALTGKLHKSLSGVLEEPTKFIQEAIQALAPGGDCTGLAYRSEAGKQLLGEFLRCALKWAVGEEMISRGREKIVLAAVERLEAGLSEWAEHPDWLFLKRPPRSVASRVLHFHCSILDVPMYPLVAAPLHRGITAKIDQLAHLPADRADRLLGGAIQPVIHIVRAVPSEAVAGLSMGTPPAEIDMVIWEAIRSMPRRRHHGRPGIAYARSSLLTFMNNWRALFHAFARERDFEPGRFHGRHLSCLEEIHGLDDEDLSDADHKLYLQRLEAQIRLEEKELGFSDRSRPGPKNRTGKAAALDAGRAIVALTPSSTIPGALPLVVISLIHEWLDEIEGDGPSLNACTTRALLLMMLHSGRRPEWLLEIRLGNRPSSLQAYTQPVYDPSRRIFFHRPDEYLGLPNRFSLHAESGDRDWEEFLRRWRDHDSVYESIQLIWEVPLPATLQNVFSLMLRTRKRVLRSKAVHPKSGCDSLWLWEDGTRLVPLGMNHVGGILADLTAFIRKRMPGYPMITPANFCRTFEGRYADAGLCPEYRWYISGRLAHGAEMETRYSRVSSRGIAAAYADAVEKVHHSYAEENRSFGISMDCGHPFDTPISSPQETAEEFFGSWRVARRDLVIDLVRESLAGLQEPGRHEPNLPKRQAIHNARVRAAVIGLGLLSGVRKSEICLLRRQDVDLEDGRVAIHGKPHRARPAYRRLPLLPKIAALIGRIHSRAERIGHPKRKMFALIDNEGRMRDLNPSGVEGILTFMGERMGVTRMPDFYGLRHRFRSDLFARGVSTDAIDYLMGHESMGMEAHSIYRDSTIEDLEEIYRKAAGDMAREYGWMEETV
jgi:hypothetical protein